MTDENATTRRQHRAAREHLARYAALREAVQAQTAAWTPGGPQDAAEQSTTPETEAAP